MAPILVSVSCARMETDDMGRRQYHLDVVYLITTYIHDDIEGSKGNKIHELGMDIYRLKAILE